MLTFMSNLRTSRPAHRLAVVGVIAATALVLNLAGAIPSFAADRYISVSASGSVKVVPDTVRVNASVSVLAQSSSEASSQAGATAAAMRAALKANQIAAQYIKSQNLSVYPEYQYTQDKGSVLSGYRATQSFEIIIRNAKGAGAVVDALIAAGGNNLSIDGVTPFLYDETAASDAARANAVAHAKAKATSYAKLLGVKLASVTYLEESSGIAPFPMMALAKSDVGATQIDLGQQDVSVSVNVRWAIK